MKKTKVLFSLLFSDIMLEIVFITVASPEGMKTNYWGGEETKTLFHRTIDWLSYLKKYMLTFQSKMRFRTLETSLDQKNQKHWVYLIDPWRYVFIPPKGLE